MNGVGVLPVWPRPGVPGSHLVCQLGMVLDALGQASGTSDAAQIVERYLGWANLAQTLLAPCLSDEDVRRLVLTERFWIANANPSPGQATTFAIQTEIVHRRTALEDARDRLARFLDAWRPTQGPLPELPETIMVLDTNVYIQHRLPIAELVQTPQAAYELIAADTHPNRLTPAETPLRIVVPMLVVDELDRLKLDRQNPQPGKPSRSSRARATLKYINTNLGTGAPWRPWTFTHGDRVTAPCTVQVLFDPAGHVRLPVNDDELVARSAALADLLDRPVTFVSFDTGAVLRARGSGIHAEHLTET